MQNTQTKSSIPTLEMAGEVYQLEIFGQDLHAVRTVNRNERDLILIQGGDELKEMCAKDFGCDVSKGMENEYINQEIVAYSLSRWMYFIEIPE